LQSDIRARPGRRRGKKRERRDVWHDELLSALLVTDIQRLREKEGKKEERKKKKKKKKRCWPIVLQSFPPDLCLSIAMRDGEREKIRGKKSLEKREKGGGQLRTATQLILPRGGDVVVGGGRRKGGKKKKGKYSEGKRKRESMRRKIVLDLYLRTKIRKEGRGEEENSGRKKGGSQ